MIPDLASAPDTPPTHLRDESVGERLDRNWAELLQELRVVQTGVQVLGAMLITAPFQQRFTTLDTTQVTLYLVLTATCFTTMGLLIAPVGIHRMAFRRRRKASLVRLAHHLAVAGLAGLVCVVAGCLALVADLVLGRGPALAAGATAGALLAAGWFVGPWLMVVAGRDDPRDGLADPADDPLR